MTDQLRTMLRDAADDHPEFAITGDPWRRGRRIRLGRRLAGGAGAAVTVAAVVAGTILLTTPDLTSMPEPAQEKPMEPALPDQLFEVPLNIPDISDDPLGEPAAIVYAASVRTGIFSSESRPVVVGAESGEVRAVRDADPLGHVSLSPNGTKLAVANDWRPGPSPEQADGSAPPTVLVVDMATGEASTYRLPDEGLGGGAHELTWASDSRSLAVTTIVTTQITDDGEGSGAEVYGHVDVRAGEWREGGAGVIYAFSSNDQRMVADRWQDDGPTIRNSDGANPVDVGLSQFHGVAFSPYDQQVGAVSKPGSGYTQSDPYVLETFDAVTGERTMQLDLGEYSGVRLIGWGPSWGPY